MADPPNLSVAPPRHVARAFARRRAALLGDAFADYDDAVVGGRLAEAVACSWPKRLRTTSGITRMTKRRVGPAAAWERRAVVELSTHVGDSEEKLRPTLDWLQAELTLSTDELRALEGVVRSYLDGTLDDIFESDLERFGRCGR